MFIYKYYMISFNDYIDQKIEPMKEVDTDRIDERMWFDYKTRNGKKTKKWHTDRKNYRIQINKKTGMPKEVFITPQERIRRKIGQRKAAIKRRAKQKNITAQRLKSFGVRSRFGMRYNTIGHGSKRYHRGGASDKFRENDSLYPNMLEARLLLEFPHVEVLPDLFWDFYEEKASEDGEWLMQLVSLCKDRQMVSLDKDQADDNNREFEDSIIRLNPGEYESAIMALCSDRFFIMTARMGYEKLSDESRELFDLYVDPRLLRRITDSILD